MYCWIRPTAPSSRAKTCSVSMSGRVLITTAGIPRTIRRTGAVMLPPHGHAAARARAGDAGVPDVPCRPASQPESRSDPPGNPATPEEPGRVADAAVAVAAQDARHTGAKLGFDRSRSRHQGDGEVGLATPKAVEARRGQQ